MVAARGDEHGDAALLCHHAVADVVTLAAQRGHDVRPGPDVRDS
jgi:hypothetical protein